MCGQYAYQAPAPRPVWGLDNESKARPAAQTRSTDNKNKESQLPRVERKKKNSTEAAPSLSAAPDKRAKPVRVHPCMCLCLFGQYIFYSQKLN